MGLLRRKLWMLTSASLERIALAKWDNVSIEFLFGAFPYFMILKAYVPLI